MIDEKINKTLKELELGLQDVESARKQVERTVSSFSNLNTSTLEYVSKLGIITTKIKELVDSVGKDYDQKVKAFEKDKDTVIKASNAATEKLSNATEEFKDSLFEIQTKLKYSIILNVVSLLAIAAIIFLLMR
jgi:methyl-accepting chemotaxis protein